MQILALFCLSPSWPQAVLVCNSCDFLTQSFLTDNLHLLPFCIGQIEHTDDKEFWLWKLPLQHCFLVPWDNRATSQRAFRHTRPTFSWPWRHKGVKSSVCSSQHCEGTENQPEHIGLQRSCPRLGGQRFWQLTILFYLAFLVSVGTIFLSMVKGSWTKNDGTKGGTYYFITEVLFN